MGAVSCLGRTGKRSVGCRLVRWWRRIQSKEHRLPSPLEREEGIFKRFKIRSWVGSDYFDIRFTTNV